MTSHKDRLIRLIEQDAHRRIGRLAGQLVRASSEDREEIFDQMQFERFLAESAADCQAGR